MREDDFRNALTQVELPEETQQRIIAACAAGTAGTPHTAPRSKRLPGAIAIAAAMVLVLAAGTLLPGLLNPNNSFTITAYALDASGETTLAASLAEEAADFELSINLPPYGIAASSGWVGKACGELSTSLRFYCEGKNIENITYSAENCRFVEAVELTNWEEYQKLDTDWFIQENIIQVTWPHYDDGRETNGTALRLLGESYTVDYAQQGEKNLRVQLPIYRLEDVSGGAYTFLFSREQTLPSGIAHGADYEAPTYTQEYVAQDAYITVTVTFTDGKTQQKLLRLTPQKTNEVWFSIRIEVMEP